MNAGEVLSFVALAVGVAVIVYIGWRLGLPWRGGPRRRRGRRRGPGPQ